MNTFIDLFAGGGMWTVGLGPDWSCVLANDFCPKKERGYIENWGSGNFVGGDLGAISVDLFPAVDLMAASPPCQDLSLAGLGAGFGTDTVTPETRSGCFYLMLAKLEALKAAGRLPKLVVLENVAGGLSRDGVLESFVAGLTGIGYRAGAVVMNAALFVPQSRNRLFIVCVRNDIEIPASLIGAGFDPIWHPPALVRAFTALPEAVRTMSWIPRRTLYRSV